ncbi:MAG TPA: precorrin-2 C(20)-methyltransferase [Phycisphaerales bacterium]|nr:precorrin-2 C(20)-methyltransferase [Phycisphaerales bacterium]
MKTGTLYGIGVGPGDSELITVKGARLIGESEHIFVPKARIKTESIALQIAREYISETAEIHEQIFPMTPDRDELERCWDESALEVLEVLADGKAACFLTIGDPLLYSTYIYLVRRLRANEPEVNIVTVPGIMALNAAAALTDFALGEGKESVTILPTADDLDAAAKALDKTGTVVLMKIGKRLPAILDLLEEKGVLDSSVFIAKAGQDDQVIETDLAKLRGGGSETGYLSIILTHVNKEGRS